MKIPTTSPNGSRVRRATLRVALACAAAVALGMALGRSVPNADAAIPSCAVGGAGYVPWSVKPPFFTVRCVPRVKYYSHRSLNWLTFDLAAAQGAGTKLCLQTWKKDPYYYWINFSLDPPYYTAWLPGPVNTACFLQRWSWVQWVY